MTLSSFDRWLTTDPREAQQAAFEAFCEREDLDPEDPETERLFDEAMDEGPDPDEARDRERDAEWDRNEDSWLEAAYEERYDLGD